MSRRIALAAALVAFYLCFLTSTHYWDGVLFSLYIERIAEGNLPFPTLFHPNHLLYSPVGYGLYAFLHSLGLGLRSITVLQLVNVFASVVCSALLFRVSTRIVRSPKLAWSCTLLFAFGATWWKFSTDADSYILAVLFLFAAVASALAAKPHLILVGAFLSIAMLFHELALFGYVPILVSIWLEPKRKAERLKRAVCFILFTGIAVTVAYAFAYAQTHTGPSNQSFARWLTSVSKDTKTSDSLGQLVLSNASSYLKLFGGGKLSSIHDFFSLPVLAALLLTLFCIAAVVRTTFRIRQVVQTDFSEADKPTRRVLWSWIAVYFVFLSWFEPGNAFYKLFLWPALVLLIGSYLASRGHSARLAFRWFALGLASWNFAAFIYPHAHPKADPVLYLAMQIDRELPKAAIVYYKALSPDDWYLEYFAPGRTWKPLPSAGDFQAGTKESPVCFETTALPFVQAETSPALRWALVNSQHNIRLECVKPSGD